MISKTLLRRYAYLDGDGERIHDDTDVVMPARDAKRFLTAARALERVRGWFDNRCREHLKAGKHGRHVDIYAELRAILAGTEER